MDCHAALLITAVTRSRPGLSSHRYDLAESIVRRLALSYLHAQLFALVPSAAIGEKLNFALPPIFTEVSQQ
jgi:hypothetical protein